MTSQSTQSKVAALKKIVFPAMGAGIAIAALGFLANQSQLPFLVAPLGASATLVWMAPASPLAQPRAVIGGSLVSALIGFGAVQLFGSAFWVLGLAVTLAVIAMVLLKVLHAPAGALPLLIATNQFDPSVFLPSLLAATLTLVGLGALFHRFLGTNSYPVKWW